MHRHQCLLGSSSAEEGCTDTNVYWEALLLRKDAQTPMLTGKLSAEEGCTDTNAYWEALLLRKAAQTPMLTGKLFC